MRRLTTVQIAVAALLAASPAFAYEADQQASLPDVAGRSGATAVEDVVVTANRSAQPVERVGASVTILTHAAIENAQTPVVSELLVQTPGVSYNRNGGVGTSAGVSIRGAESHHTVVIIDGVKLNDPSSTQGGFNFGNLLVGDTSRIEVLRGAQSTLWGSQAIGGVVNIVTAEPSSAFEGNASAEAGSHGTTYFRGAVGGANDRVSWRLAANRYDTDGYSAYALGSEDDGYTNTSLSGRLNVKLADDVSLDLRSVWSDGQNDFDGWGLDSREYSKTRELVAYAGLNFGLFEGRLQNRIGYAQTTTDRDNYNPDNKLQTLTFDAKGENRRWEYQGTFAFSDNLNTTFGIESERSEMRTRSPSDWSINPAYVNGNADLDSAYAQIQWTAIEGLTLTGGLRYDDHAQYGDNLLGQVAAAWTPNGGDTLLRASWGQGFRAPGLYELYSEYGNLTLAAEEFDAWELSVQQKLFDRASVTLTYFNREADNEIRYNGCSTGSTDPLCKVNGVDRWGYYANALKTEAKGVEFSTAIQLTDALSVTANYTWTDAQMASGANQGKHLSRRPEHMGNLMADYRWASGFKTGLAVRYSGETFNNDANTVVMDEYTLVDLRLAYPVSDQVELYGRVENLFDEEYQTAKDYGTAGRGVFGGVRVKF